jgi:hypothetical protein
MPSQPQNPPFRVENWLSARSCSTTRALRNRPCVLHPLLALTFLLAIALLVALVARSGVLDTVRTWTRLAAPTCHPGTSLHPMALSDLGLPRGHL